MSTARDPFPTNRDALGPRITISHTWDGAPAGRDERVSLMLALSAEGLRLTVAAPYHRDPAPAAPRGSTEGLWEHEVVELFIASAASVHGMPVYLEAELGPHGHYLLLPHKGIRQRAGRAEPSAVGTEIVGDFWSGGMVIDRRHLPPAPWVGNAYAIHGLGTDRRYLAASPLPGEAADFHQPQHFPLLRAGAADLLHRGADC